MKTALEELCYNIENRIQAFKNGGNPEYSKDEQDVLREVISSIKNVYLDQEEQQIADAYEQGRTDEDSRFPLYVDAMDYYYKKYNENNL